MAETETVARTRPARVRKAAEPAKKAVAPAAENAVTEVADETADTLTRTYIVLGPHKDGDVKNYARFVPPEDSGCVGTFYAPIGTTDVKVLLIRPGE